MSSWAEFALARAPSLSRSVPRLRRRAAGRVLLVSAAVAVILGLAYLAARETSLFALRHVELRGATDEVARDVRPVLAAAEGTSLVALDRGEVERRLREVGSVRAVSVDRAFPHTLQVRVTPERPLAVVRHGRNAWLVAESGRVVRSVPVDARPRTPRIRGERARAPRVGATLRDPSTVAALDVLRALPRPFPASVLYVEVSEGEAELVLRDGPPIRLGPPLDVARKLDAARAVLATVPATERPSLAYVDASVPERVVAASKSQP